MSVSPIVAICCCAAEPSDSERELAAQLPALLVAHNAACPPSCEFFLRFESTGLTLYHNAARAPGGLYVDFSDPELLRRSGDKLKQQNLCKAVGLKGVQRLRILDAMAGLGKDAWMLASAGADVDMLERSPIVFALLQDGIRRGRMQGVASSAVLQRMQLRHADFLHAADELPAYDVVYLDPMFPPTNKQARAKKAMYLLQQLLGESACEESALLTAARKLAQRRVVVKRARLSPYLANLKPDIEFKGSANRYDVYMCNV